MEKSKLAQAITLFGLYSAGSLLEFRTGHQIPEDFCGFLTSSRKMEA